MRSLEARTELVEQFVAARTRLAEGKVADAMVQCETMIGEFILIFGYFWLFWLFWLSYPYWQLD
jgi:hypothetical protein